mmetsp:Transcript_131795/g.357901  ORF Transcript_131795/g.357901 Transcript_131795/m.357901 type:complete len:222 (-) Transcript_131795:554-1219(-)
MENISRSTGQPLLWQSFPIALQECRRQTHPRPRNLPRNYSRGSTRRSPAAEVAASARTLHRSAEPGNQGLAAQHIPRVGATTATTTRPHSHSTRESEAPRAPPTPGSAARSCAWTLEGGLMTSTPDPCRPLPRGPELSNHISATSTRPATTLRTLLCRLAPVSRSGSGYHRATQLEGDVWSKRLRTKTFHVSWDYLESYGGSMSTSCRPLEPGQGPRMHRR